jgi:hypothetical protein
MSISAIEIAPPRAANVRVDDDALTVELTDGRIISAPLSWYPRLVHGSAEERAGWRLIGDGEGIHWSALDEDLSLESLVAGRPSAEGAASLARWLQGRGS